VRAGWPEIDDVIDRISSIPSLRVGLTGSGGAVFALFEKRDAVDAAAEVIGKRWKMHVGKTLTRTQAALRTFRI
jgi:4-diphosphocytidyl-2C-methyl-D-erythritol kinase